MSGTKYVKLPSDRLEVVRRVILRMRGTVRRRDVADVLSAIAILGERNVRIVGLAHARLNRKHEIGDLRAGIVVIELAMDFHSLPFEQGCDRVAYGCTAPMANVKRTRRVCRDEFDHRATGHRGRTAIAVG